jgi:hypothetical protein
LGETDAQQVSDIDPWPAGRHRQHSREAFVEAAIRRGFAPSVDLLSLLAGKLNRFHEDALPKGRIHQVSPPAARIHFSRFSRSERIIKDDFTHRGDRR